MRYITGNSARPIQEASSIGQKAPIRRYACSVKPSHWRAITFCNQPVRGYQELARQLLTEGEWPNFRRWMQRRGPAVSSINNAA
jgi:hypothetical protein